ncbi:MAG: aminopeptidase P family protein [Lewinellaceae bacterium]|nr:aminopeptidase P family protein [Lewinellaceae bacterium]
MFDRSVYVGRRQRLARDLDSGIALLLGNDYSSRNYPANVYRFRQDSNFLYFTGLNRPQLAAIIDIDAGTTTLFGDDAGIEDVVWSGPQPTLASLAGQSGIEQVSPFSGLPDTFSAARKSGRKIHFLPPYRAENKIMLHHWLGIPFPEMKQQASVAMIQAVVAQAAHKSAEEVAEIEKAVNVSGQMHVAVMKAARPGQTEAQMMALAESIAKAANYELAYGAIVTINGQTLHNESYHNTLKEGQLLLMDMGAETEMGYAGDITRTLPVSSRFTPQQRDIYQIVLETEVGAIQASKPGVPYKDVHLGAALRIAEGLKSLGLMQGNVQDAVEAGAHALFFPHGLGHMMGLDVHDMEDLGEDYVGYSDAVKRSTQFGLAYLRLARPLEPGFVLTVEPGIYFIPELIKLWGDEGKHKAFINYEKLAGYLNFGGIRVEDNILITKDGHQVLGDPIPKTVEEVENLRN